MTLTQVNRLLCKGTHLDNMKNLKYITLVIIFALFGTSSQAQTNSYLTNEDSDPEAIKLLNDLKEKYEGFDNMQMDFSLEIEIPEDDMIIQKGQMVQQKEKFYLDFEQQSITSNGDKVWVHLKNNNEVQIHNAAEMNEDENFMSPQNMLKLYESDAFIFGISDELVLKGKTVALIECKPIDRDSEYSKLRLTVDIKNMDMVSIKAFSKDGSRYTFINDKLISNVALPATKFEFDAAAFPDIYVEDMRDY